MTPPDETIKVQLARIEGKMDLSNQRHDNNERRLDNHEQRLHRHGNDISSLQAANLIRDTERKSVISGGRIVGWLISVLIGGGIATAGLELLK